LKSPALGILYLWVLPIQGSVRFSIGLQGVPCFPSSHYIIEVPPGSPHLTVTCWFITLVSQHKSPHHIMPLHCRTGASVLSPAGSQAAPSTAQPHSAASEGVLKGGILFGTGLGAGAAANGADGVHYSGAGFGSVGSVDRDSGLSGRLSRHRGVVYGGNLIRLIGVKSHLE
jgi:hypothetical protein